MPASPISPAKRRPRRVQPVAGPSRSPRSPLATPARRGENIQLEDTQDWADEDVSSSRAGQVTPSAEVRRRSRQTTSTDDIPLTSSLESLTSPSTPRSKPPPQPRQKQKDAPALHQTLSILLTPIRLLRVLLEPFISPIIFHVVNSIILILLAVIFIYFFLPMLLFRAKVALGLPFKLVWNLVRTRTLLGGESLSELLALPSLRLGGLGGGAGNWTMSLGQKGAQAVAGICGVMPWLCGKGVGRKKESYDVGKVARALHREAQTAQNIFESVISLGNGGVDNGLYHTKVWELAAAVRTSSHLPDRSKLGTDLMQLGDLSRDLSDEIAALYAQTNSAFSWIAHDFDRLNSLLSLPDPTSRPTPSQLSSLIHSVILRTQSKFDDLYLATERALPAANQASEMGGGLMLLMMGEEKRLELEMRGHPRWQGAVEWGKELAVGIKEPTKREILKRDLELSKATVGNLKEIRQGLERTRALLKLHRTHVGSFSSSMMGFHLGAGGFGSDDEMGLGAEAELEVFSRVVKEMKEAVEGSRRGTRGREEGREGRVAIDDAGRR